MTTQIPSQLVKRVVTITGPAFIADASLGDIFLMTMAENSSLSVINMSANQPLLFFVEQGGSGSYTLSYDATVNWGAAGEPTLSTTVGAVDLLGGLYNTSLDALLMAPSAIGYT